MSSNILNSHHLLKREECLLVVIDMQERLLPAMTHRDSVAGNVKRLVSFSAIIGLPLLVTEQDKLGSTVPDLLQQRQDSRPISKISFNCFDCDEFADAVRRSGRTALVLTGLEAHICVAQTALHALEHFRVHVVRDGVSSRTEANWETALERMRAAGVTITSTEMVIYELLKMAGTEEFKKTLPLVK